MHRRLLALLLVAVLTAFVVVAVGCGGDEETTTTAPESSETTAPAGDGSVDGAAVFASTCAACHGADGTGASGPDLTPLGEGDLDKVKAQVTNGGGSMPAYGDKLSAEEIDAVAAYAVGLE